MCKFEIKNKYVWWINNCIIVLCVPRLMSSVHEMDYLGKETVSVSGRSGKSCSVHIIFNNVWLKKKNMYTVIEVSMSDVLLIFDIILKY